MSPGSGVKSEYMKRYREPRWDQYASCYRELLRYRLGRRLLEQAHAPWLWDSWGPDGASDGSASPAADPSPRCASASPVEAPEAGERGAEAPEAAEATEAWGAETQDQQDAALPEALPVEDVEEKARQYTKKEETDRLPTSVKPRQQPSALFARGNRKAPQSPQRSLSKSKEDKHPVALYGWGERPTLGARRPTVSVHLPLCTRFMSQPYEPRAEDRWRNGDSADVEKHRRIKASTRPSADKPWVTGTCDATRPGHR